MSNKREWTPGQKQAINSLDGTILVSAAAGSGKTAVLVERIIKRITDPVSPSSVDRLLVVTFTKAAAAEMKDRLSKELSKHILENPTDPFLKRQKMYLSEAQICTMDSFCSRLVKENYETLGISPDFGTLSDSENAMYLDDAADFVLNEIYGSKNENDHRLLELFTDNKDDGTLRYVLKNLYKMAYADKKPYEWLDNIFSPYFEQVSASESPWGKYALSVLREKIEFIIEKAEKIISDSQGYQKLEGAVINDLASPVDELKKILESFENPDWDKIRDDLGNVSLGNFPRFSAEEKDGRYFEIKARRDIIKNDLKSLKSFLICTSKDFEDDIEYLRPIMFALKERAKQFIEKLSEMKAENNKYYFDDLLHFSLDLLYEEKDGVSVKTELAKELQEEFDEILIDEFQDTNDAQVSLFNAISKDGSNEFIVGDVKQSIYAFRQACPEIFVSLLKSKEVFDGENYPAKIYLDSNFRSRRGVVEAVNFFFDCLMVPELGGLNYKETERLKFASVSYAEHDTADAELHIVRSASALSSNLSCEARYIGNLIKKMIADRVKVGPEDNEHTVEYRDICILLRSVKNRANIIAGELSEMGIPVHYKKDGGFFDNAEIMTVISMLKTIDNPLSDVPLLSVLLSPMTGFTEDDIAAVRADHKHGSLYSALKNSESKNEKSKNFLYMLDYFRTLSVTLSVSDLIRRIFEYTSYDSVVAAMNSGEKRVLNLQKLISFADAFSEGGQYGLSGFIRYIEKLQKSGYDLEGAETVSETDNAVRIMTFHKSKGLEFPVVILANTGSTFFKDSNEKLPVNKMLGAGALRYLPDENREIKTQIYHSVMMKNVEENAAESLRLLYVAMTRAKEKLIIVGSAYNPEKKISDLYYGFNVSEDKMYIPIKNLKSFLDWILLAMLNHPSFSVLPYVKNFTSRNELVTEGKIDVHICEEFDVVEENEIETQVCSADFDVLKQIKEKVSFVYPYDFLAGFETKYTASSMNEFAENEFFASENPAFLSEGKITPTKRGTLIHKFMEVCDMSKAAENIDGEAERLLENGTFTEFEIAALQKGKISNFFRSDMFKRISEAETFFREKQFTLSLPLCEIQNASDIPKDEFAVVQGVIDGLIINGDTAEIIDYKTDRVKSAEELCDRYKMQMYVYKKAAEECFGAENVKVTLYSFELSQEISVKFEKNT